MKALLTLAALFTIFALLQARAQANDATPTTSNPIALRNAQPAEAKARRYGNYGYYDDPCCYDPYAHYQCQDLCCNYAQMNYGLCIDYACYCY